MYLDPGSGGMLIQILFAIAAAGGALIYALRKQIRSLFSKSKKNDESVAQTKVSSEKFDDDLIDALSDSGKSNEND